jgi:hypothetical protein
MEATVALFDRWGTIHAGLFTFAHSPKHHGPYQKFGFWPRFLTPIMAKPVSGEPTRAPAIRYTEFPPAEQEQAVTACRELATTAYDGLDLEREIRTVQSQSLGEVVLVDDASGLAGMAVCISGPVPKPAAAGAMSSLGWPDPDPARPSASGRCSTPARP